MEFWTKSYWTRMSLSELYRNSIISRIYRRFEQYFFSAFIRHLTFIQNPSISVFLIVGHKSRMWCQTGLGKSFSEGNFFIAKKSWRSGGAARKRTIISGKEIFGKMFISVGWVSIAVWCSSQAAAVVLHSACLGDFDGRQIAAHILISEILGWWGKSCRRP